MPSPKKIKNGGNNKINKNNQNCGSSSSDEAEHIGNGGWPSTVSVLETPDRKRVRSSLRLNNKQLLNNKNNLIPEISFSSSSSSSIISTSLLLNNNSSPPFNNRLSNSFCSPTLRTPKQSLTNNSSSSIHLSGSPLRSFFIKEKQQISPSSSSFNNNNYSFSNYLNKEKVLRPLNLQNYNDFQLNENNKNNLIESSSTSSNLKNDEKIIDEENKILKEQQKRRISKDSGFSDETQQQLSSNESQQNLSSQSILIETPSKGLNSIIQPLFHSTPLLRSPSPLLLFDLLNNNNNNNPSTSSNFHSPIPEQSYGPLEASIVDGILNDLDKMQPGTSSGIKQQTSIKHQNLTLAFQIVKNCNSELNINNKKILYLITSLISILLQLRNIGIQKKCLNPQDAQIITESLKQIRLNIAPKNAAAFQDYIEVHMKQILKLTRQLN